MNTKTSKTLRKGLSLLSVILVGMTLGLSAQGPGPRGPQDGQGQDDQFSRVDHFLRSIPDITPEQREKVQKLHIDFMKVSNSLRAQIAEKEAHLEVLATADKPSMSEINGTIDGLFELKTALAKERMGLRMDVRALLTPEQKVVFDRKIMNMGQERRQGPRGNGPGQNGPQGRPQGAPQGPPQR